MAEIKLNREYSLYYSESIAQNSKQLKRFALEQIKKYSPFDILCPVFLDTKGEIFYHGGGFTLYEKIPYPDAQGERDINQYPKIREVDFSPFWAFIISNKALKKMRPIPKFEVNIYKHADFCLRARELGFKIQVSPDFKLTYKHAYFMQRDQKKWMTKFQILHKWFIRKWGKKLDNEYRLPTVMHTHTGYPGGYCMHAKSLIQFLLKKKIKLHYKFIGGANDDEPDSDIFPVDDLRADMGSHKLPQVVLSTGLNCFSNSGKYKIGFTTTEVSGIPKDWVRVLNEMDEVWTTSEFAKLAFESSGVKKPIFNMREGIDPAYFHPGIKPFKSNVGKKFLFISNFAWGRRKGVDILFEAFSKEFSDKEDVALVIKALPSYKDLNIKKEMAKLYHRPHGALIHVWDTVFPAYLLGQFYTAGHVFVFPTRGEGFGIPPAEALASGLPVIATGYSAHTEFLVKNGKPLPGVEFVKGHTARFDGSDSVYYHGFDWFQPSMSDLRKKMRKVYNNYKKYKADALQSSKFIRKEWTWDASADRVIKRLEVIDRKINAHKIFAGSSYPTTRIKPKKEVKND